MKRTLGFLFLFFLLTLSTPCFAKYSVRLGVLLEDMSKENVERIKSQSQEFHYHTGIDLRMVIQKRHDLLIRLFQNKDVDFLLTGLSQVLALEKANVPFKIILRGYRPNQSDSFILLLSHKKNKAVQDDLLLTAPLSSYIQQFPILVIGKKLDNHPLVIPDTASLPKKVLERDVQYSIPFFKKLFTDTSGAIVLDLASFNRRLFGMIKSYRDRLSIEKACGCKVYKMSAPIPPGFVIVRQDFFQQHPLQTYKLMEFFLTSEKRSLHFFHNVLNLDGFTTATNNATTPFSFLLSRFNFHQLATLDL